MVTAGDVSETGQMYRFIHNLAKDSQGATAIEYGLIAALIAVAATAAMGSLGNSLSNTFNLVSTDMSNAQDGKY